jgi:hypothetical protein
MRSNVGICSDTDVGAPPYYAWKANRCSLPGEGQANGALNEVNRIARQSHKFFIHANKPLRLSYREKSPPASPSLRTSNPIALSIPLVQPFSVARGTEFSCCVVGALMVWRTCSAATNSLNIFVHLKFRVFHSWSKRFYQKRRGTLEKTLLLM